jgi:hypothetical protein
VGGSLVKIALCRSELVEQPIGPPLLVISPVTQRANEALSVGELRLELRSIGKRRLISPATACAVTLIERLAQH